MFAIDFVSLAFGWVVLWKLSLLNCVREGCKALKGYIPHISITLSGAVVKVIWYACLGSYVSIQLSHYRQPSVSFPSFSISVLHVDDGCWRRWLYIPVQLDHRRKKGMGRKPHYWWCPEDFWINQRWLLWWSFDHMSLNTYFPGIRSIHHEIFVELKHL